MKKVHSVTIRLSDKTYNRIESLRKQIVDRTHIDHDDITDSLIIRQAIIMYDEKFRYFVFDFDLFKKDLK